VVAVVCEEERGALWTEQWLWVAGRPSLNQRRRRSSCYLAQGSP